MYPMSPPPSAPSPLHTPPDWLNWAGGSGGAKSANLEHAFEVRNLLVDESVPDWRARNYGRCLTGNAIAGVVDWKGLPDAARTWLSLHGKYFE
jgi:hypothetical protein